MTNAPASITQPVLSTYVGHDQEHFVYLLAANGEIWDAFYCPNCSGNSWRSQKINSRRRDKRTGGRYRAVCRCSPSGSRPAALRLPCQQWRDLGRLLVPENAAAASGSCRKINLGESQTARPPRLGLSISEYLIGQPANGVHNQQHFAFKGGDVWDAYYCPPCGGNGWKLQEITAGGVTSGPPAASSLPPSVSVFSEHDQQHFAYVTASGQIRDAWYCGNCGGSSWNLQQLAGP